MPPIVGKDGIVTSWAGTANAQLLTALGENVANLSEGGGNGDRTAFASGLTNTAMGPGLRDWTCAIQGKLLSSGAAEVGYAGGLAFGGSLMYATNLISYSLNIAATEHDVTAYGTTATAAGWKQFKPGIMTVTGQFTALVDDTNAMKNLFAPGAALPTATFTLTSGNTLAGSIIPTSRGTTMDVGGLQTVSYDFAISGALTAAGTGNLFAAAAVGMPDYDFGTPANNNLVITHATGRTSQGPAFWTSIGITHAPASYIEVAITARGYGALTPA